MMDDHLLLEDGSDLLMEDGVGFLLLEDRPGGGGAGIVMGRSFTRKQWKELQQLIAAEKAAAAKAERVAYLPRGAALAEAAERTQDAIASLENVEDRQAHEPDMERLRGHLARAIAAKHLAVVRGAAAAAARLAMELQARAEDEEEVMLLLH